MSKGLKSGGVSLLSGTSISLNGCSPAYSMAITLGLIAPFAGDKAPAVVLIAFPLMFMITVPYMLLTRYYPDCGASFSWVTRAMSAYVGAVFGVFGLVMTFLLMPTLFAVFASYCYLLAGLESASTSTLWTVVGGLVTIGVIVFLAIREVKIGVAINVVLAVFQMIALVLLAIVIIIKVSDSSAYLSWSMLSPFGLSWSQISGGILIALYIYMGWDSVAAMAEETTGKLTAALSMLLSTVLLVSVYILVTIAATAFRGPEYLSENYADVLAAVARDALGSPWDKVIILAVLASGFAVLTTAMLVWPRWTLAMASFQALPRSFGKVSQRTHVPVWGTVFFGVVFAVVLVVENIRSSTFIWDSFSGVVLLSPLMYFLPALGAPILLRRWIMRSVKNFFLMLVIPLLGAVLMSVVTVKGFLNYLDPVNSYSEPILGIPVPIWAAGVMLGLSIVYMVIWRVVRPEFFTKSVDELGMTCADDAPGAPIDVSGVDSPARV